MIVKTIVGHQGEDFQISYYLDKVVIFNVKTRKEIYMRTNHYWEDFPDVAQFMMRYKYYVSAERDNDLVQLFRILTQYYNTI